MVTHFLISGISFRLESECDGGIITIRRIKRVLIEIKFKEILRFPFSIQKCAMGGRTYVTSTSGHPQCT